MDFQHILDNLYNQLNECRQYPKETANKLIQLRPAFQGRTFKGKYRTREGITALDDLICDFSQRQQIKNRLKWSFALHMAADEQATILGQKGLFTTQSTSFHRALPDRISQYAIIKGRISQIYEFGGRTCQQILQQLLIDDGLLSRKRRNTLMDPTFKYIGIGSCYHQKNESCTVIILAQQIVSLVAPGEMGRYRKRNGVQTGTQNVVRNLQHKQINNILGQIIQSDFVPKPENNLNNNNYLAVNDLNKNSQVINQPNIENNNKSQGLFILDQNAINIQTQQSAINKLNSSRQYTTNQSQLPTNEVSRVSQPSLINNNIIASKISNDIPVVPQKLNNQQLSSPSNTSAVTQQPQRITLPAINERRQGSVIIYQPPNNSLFHPSLTALEKSSQSRVYQNYNPINNYASQNQNDLVPYYNHQSNNTIANSQNQVPYKQKVNEQYELYRERLTNPPPITITQSPIPKPVSAVKKQQSKCSIM